MASIDSVLYRRLVVERHPIAAHFYIRKTNLMVDQLEA
jgi:hypothetical protein